MFRLLMYFTIWNWINNLHAMIFPSQQNIIGIFRLGKYLAHDISFKIWKLIASRGGVHS